jgi:hypothetical protein
MSNNISVLSWGSTLLAGETGVSTKKHWPVTVYKQNDHIILYFSKWEYFSGYFQVHNASVVFLGDSSLLHH